MVVKPPVQKLRPDQHVAAEVSDKQIDLIGRVIVLWSKLEAALDDTIWFFLGLDDEDGKIVTKSLSADAKVQRLRALGPGHISDEKLLKSFNENLRLIDELKEARNLIAHGVWGTMMPEDVPIALSLKPKSEIGEVVSESFPPERMEAIADGIREMRKRLVDLPESLDSPRRVPR